MGKRSAYELLAVSVPLRGSGDESSAWFDSGVVDGLYKQVSVPLRGSGDERVPFYTRLREGVPGLKTAQVNFGIN